MHGELNETRTDIPTAAKVMFLDQAANFGVIDWLAPITSIRNKINPVLTKARSVLSILAKKYFVYFFMDMNWCDIVSIDLFEQLLNHSCYL